MRNENPVFGMRTRARMYSVGAIGLSVAGVVGFFSTVGSTAAHAVVRPIATARTTSMARHARTRAVAVPSQPAPSSAAAQASTPGSGPSTPRPVRSVAAYVPPSTNRAPATAVKPVVSAPKPSPKPVTVAPKPAPAPQPVAPPPPPTQTHSS